VCQYALPFYERLYQRLKGKDITFVGVSEDDARDTALFAREFGVTFPIVLDLPDRYPVSAAYGLTNVPTLFVIGSTGMIEQSLVSWSKKELEELYREYLDSATAQSPLFEDKEMVAEFRAG
jgi:peroxiredoxin